MKLYYPLLGAISYPHIFVPEEQLVGSSIFTLSKCSIGTPCPVEVHQSNICVSYRTLKRV